MTTNIRFGALSRCLVVGALLLPWGAAQTDSQGILTGSWVVTADIYGTPSYLRMELKQEARISQVLLPAKRPKVRSPATPCIFHPLATKAPLPRSMQL